MPAIRTSVAGIKHHAGSYDRLKDLPHRALLQLRHEMDNPHDKNAVAVYHKELKLGYVPRYEAKKVAAILEQGLLVKCTTIRQKVPCAPLIRIEWQTSKPRTLQELLS